MQLYLLRGLRVSRSVAYKASDTAMPTDSGIETLHRFADSGSRASSPPINDFTTVTTEDREPSRATMRQLTVNSH